MSGYISMDSVSDIKLNGVDVEKIAQGVNTLWEKNVIEPFNVKNISQSVATVDWNTGADNRNLQYSEDKTNWTNVPYANNKYSITIPVGKKYYFQGNSTNFGGWWGSDQDVEISGYVLSLHYPTMEIPVNQTVRYYHLFTKNDNGTLDGKLHFDFSKLKIPGRLGSDGCAWMFYGCSSVTELNYDIFYDPDDNYTVGAWGFGSMFRDCVNLTRIEGFTVGKFGSLAQWRELEATFSGCTSLEYVWDGLFDTTVTPSTCYFRDYTCTGMFDRCISLTHPPKLPSVRGGTAFDSMFSGCTSLTTSATQRILPTYNGIGTQDGEYSNAGIFQGMFRGCTGLTSMHDLSSYTMGSYGYQYFYQMYYGCTGITSIDAEKMPGGVATANCFSGMFANCTGITTIPSGFIKPTNVAESCYQSMFEGCTNLTTIPSGLLPAMTMAKNCYHSMFRSTTRLANVPYDLLPATTVAEGCYTLMFQYSNHGFTGLHLGATDLGTSAFANWIFFDCPISQLEVDFKEWTSATTDWVLRTSNRGTFTKYEALPEIYDTSHIPVGWTVVNKYASESPTITHDASNVIIVNNTYNSGGVIYYTTDGSTPTNASSVYSQPFPAVLGQTIKAICIYHDIVSDVASWTVAATQLTEPAIYGIPSQVTIINKDTSGVGTVYYTTDGTTPTSASTLYTQPFAVTDGATVKAICMNDNGYLLYNNSNVVTYEVHNYEQLSYIHNQSIQNNPPLIYAIDTGVVMDDTIKFRYKGKFVGSGSNNVIVGDIGSSTNNSDRLRLYFDGGNVQLDWGDGTSGSYRHGNAYYDFGGHPDMDLTCGNLYSYDNFSSTTLFNTTQGNYMFGKTMKVDCSCFWLQSLQIWKTIGGVETLVFDGVAAEQNGTCGLFDRVTKNLCTNSNITIVGEPYHIYFEDRSGAANTITCTKTGDQVEWLNLQYSTDERNWANWNLTQTLTIPANGRVYLRGSNTIGFGKDNSNYHSFTCSGNYALGGDLFSIMDDSLFAYPSRFGSRTFNGSTTLVDISQLVFGNKYILGTTFTWMFQNCSALTSLPSEIGLSYSPSIDFATHTSHFTQMFQTDPIANFPRFPNITTIGRDGMYRIAQSNVGTPNTNLTYVDLSNITTLYYRALYQAFQYASNLEVVKIGISAWPDFVDSTASDYNATFEWLYGVHPTGVFCKNSTLPVMRGDNYIPNNWSIADLNGKLYDPVITNTNNTITIAEGGGGSSSTIYYTTDGSDPDTTSNVYSSPFSVLAGTVIKTFADYTPTGSNVPLITHSNITTYTVQ